MRYRIWSLFRIASKSNSAPLPNVQEHKLYFTVEIIETGRRTPNSAAFSRFFAKDYIVDSTIGRKALTLIPIDVVIGWSPEQPIGNSNISCKNPTRLEGSESETGSWTKLCPYWERAGYIRHNGREHVISISKG